MSEAFKDRWFICGQLIKSFLIRRDVLNPILLVKDPRRGYFSQINVLHYNIKELDSKKIRERDQNLKRAIDLLNEIPFDSLSLNDIQYASVICMPNTPVPTSHFLTKDLYIGSREIISKVANIFQLNEKNLLKDFKEPKWHDVPGEWFKGPF